MRFLIAILLLSQTVAFAQPKLTASLDRTTVRVGESFTLSASFDGSASGVSSPVLPQLGGVKITGGPFTSTNMSIVNGRTASSITYSYRMVATKEGKYQIGPLTVNYQGKPYESAPINISILPAGAQVPGQSNSDSAPGESVFIRAVPDRTEVYQGEQLTVSYKIFFNVQMTNPEITQIPRAPGFWMEEVTLPQQLHLNDEVVNGKAYKSATIRKLALFPTTSGELVVEPMEVHTKIERKQRKGRDPLSVFDDPFFRLGSAMEPVEVMSPELKVRARPLPDGAPPEFQGAVGIFKISAAFERGQVMVNDAVTLTVRIEGAGNIKTLPEPLIKFPVDFDRFDPKQSEQISRGARISGVKTFEYVLIPRAPGEQRIPGIQYAYFDPATDKYQSISTQPLVLQVVRGTGEVGGSSGPSVQRRDVTSVGTDIAYVKKQSGSFHPRGKAPHQTAVFWTLTTAPWLAAGFVLLVARRREQKDASIPSFTRQIRRAEKQLSLAAKVQHKDPAEAIRLTLLAIDEVIYQPGFAEGDSINKETVRAQWLEAGKSIEALDKLFDIQHECNLARFGIGKTDSELGKKMIRETQNALSAIEKSSQKSRVVA